MKSLYLIRNGKSGWEDPEVSDFERGLRKKGRKEVKTIASYLRLRGIHPEVVLSSCALRAQETADLLAEILDFDGPTHYLDALYRGTSEEILDMIGVQEDEVGRLFVVGHTPQLHELAHQLTGEHLQRFPPMGVVAIEFESDSWSEIASEKGRLDFFIYPKQFRYYMPEQIRAHLPR